MLFLTINENSKPNIGKENKLSLEKYLVLQCFLPRQQGNDL